MTEAPPEATEKKKRIDLKAFLSIIRPQNCIIGGLTVIAGIAIAYQQDPSPIVNVSGFKNKLKAINN